MRTCIIFAGLAAEFGLITNPPETENSATPTTPPSIDSTNPIKPLTYIGVGQAGFAALETQGGVCPPGCKWTAVAGLVLQMPDHEAVHAAAAAAREHTFLHGSGSMPTGNLNIDINQGVVQGSSGLGRNGGGVEGEGFVIHQDDINNGGGLTGNSNNNQQQGQQQQQGEGIEDGICTVPLCVFRNWDLDLSSQQEVIKAVDKCNWPQYGFTLINCSLQSADPTPSTESATSGTVHLTLKCAQPKSGAAFVAAVVHLQSQEVANQAKKGVVKGPAGTHEVRIIKAAIEAALAEIKAQVPEVMASRRERSALRGIPLVAQAVSGE